MVLLLGELIEKEIFQQDAFRYNALNTSSHQRPELTAKISRRLKKRWGTSWLLADILTVPPHPGKIVRDCFQCTPESLILSK
jgi:hypothetical protein